MPSAQVKSLWNSTAYVCDFSNNTADSTIDEKTESADAPKLDASLKYTIARRLGDCMSSILSLNRPTLLRNLAASSELDLGRQKRYDVLMAAVLIISATLLVLAVFVFITQGPQAGFASCVFLAIAALVVAPMASRPRNGMNRNIRRVSMVMWGLMFYCGYKCLAEKGSLGWAVLEFACLLIAVVTAITYLVVQNQRQ